MTHSSTLMALAALALTAGCSRPPATSPDGNGASLGGAATGNIVVPPDETATPPAAAANSGAAAPDQAAYLGRWTGVEGMYLVVSAKPTGGVSLEMQWDLDHKGTFDGTVTAKGVRFTRDGATETLVHSDGDATGLKYLAGKKDCLTVKPGEGYCRS